MPKLDILGELGWYYDCLYVLSLGHKQPLLYKVLYLPERIQHFSNKGSKLPYDLTLDKKKKNAEILPTVNLNQPQMIL